MILLSEESSMFIEGLTLNSLYTCGWGTLEGIDDEKISFYPNFTSYIKHEDYDTFESSCETLYDEVNKIFQHSTTNGSEQISTIGSYNHTYDKSKSLNLQISKSPNLQISKSLNLQVKQRIVQTRNHLDVIVFSMNTITSK